MGNMKQFIPKETMTCKCGNKFKPQYRNEIIISKICPKCESEARINKNKALLERSYMKLTDRSSTSLKQGKKKKSPRQRAMDRSDEWFSKYIRLKYSFESCGEFVCRCYTCGSLHGIKSIDCGHYVNREQKTVRFDENNARPQCVFCNQHRSGRHVIFGTNLQKEVGAEEVDRIRQLSLFSGEDNEQFYREQSDKYRKMFNELLIEKKINNPWQI